MRSIGNSTDSGDARGRIGPRIGRNRDALNFTPFGIARARGGRVWVRHVVSRPVSWGRTGAIVIKSAKLTSANDRFCYPDLNKGQRARIFGKCPQIARISPAALNRPYGAHWAPTGPISGPRVQSARFDGVSPQMRTFRPLSMFGRMGRPVSDVSLW